MVSRSRVGSCGGRCSQPRGQRRRDGTARPRRARGGLGSMAVQSGRSGTYGISGTGDRSTTLPKYVALGGGISRGCPGRTVFTQRRALRAMRPSSCLTADGARSVPARTAAETISLISPRGSAPPSPSSTPAALAGWHQYRRSRTPCRPLSAGGLSRRYRRLRCKVQESLFLPLVAANTPRSFGLPGQRLFKTAPRHSRGRQASAIDFDTIETLGGNSATAYTLHARPGCVKHALVYRIVNLPLSANVQNDARSSPLLIH